MGREKKNKPRRQRLVPNAVVTDDQAAKLREEVMAAAVLELPAISSETQTGMVLDVAAVGIPGSGMYVPIISSRHLIPWAHSQQSTRPW